MNSLQKKLCKILYPTVVKSIIFLCTSIILIALLKKGAIERGCIFNCSYSFFEYSQSYLTYILAWPLLIALTLGLKNELVLIFVSIFYLYFISAYFSTLINRIFSKRIISNDKRKKMLQYFILISLLSGLVWKANVIIDSNSRPCKAGPSYVYNAIDIVQPQPNLNISYENAKGNIISDHFIVKRNDKTNYEVISIYVDMNLESFTILSTPQLKCGGDIFLSHGHEKDTLTRVSNDYGELILKGRGKTQHVISYKNGANQNLYFNVVWGWNKDSEKKLLRVKWLHHNQFLELKENSKSKF